MRVHSPLVGECDPSLICRHWDSFEPPVGSTVLRVGAPSVQCLGSLHNPDPVGDWFSLIFLWCSNPRIAYSPMKTAQDTAQNKHRLPSNVTVS